MNCVVCSKVIQGEETVSQVPCCGGNCHVDCLPSLGKTHDCTRCSGSWTLVSPVAPASPSSKISDDPPIITQKGNKKNCSVCHKEFQEGEEPMTFGCCDSPFHAYCIPGPSLRCPFCGYDNLNKRHSSTSTAVTNPKEEETCAICHQIIPNEFLPISLRCCQAISHLNCLPKGLTRCLLCQKQWALQEIPSHSTRQSLVSPPGSPRSPLPKYRYPATLLSFDPQLHLDTISSIPGENTAGGAFLCSFCHRGITATETFATFGCCDHPFHEACRPLMRPTRCCPLCNSSWCSDAPVISSHPPAIICVMCEEEIPPTETPRFNWCCKDKNPYHAKCRDFKPYLHCPLCNTSWCSEVVSSESPVHPTRKALPLLPLPLPPPRDENRGPSPPLFFPRQLKKPDPATACKVCGEVIQDDDNSASYACCPQNRYHRRCEIGTPQRFCPFCRTDWWRNVIHSTRQLAVSPPGAPPPNPRDHDRSPAPQLSLDPPLPLGRPIAEKAAVTAGAVLCSFCHQDIPTTETPATFGCCDHPFHEACRPLRPTRCCPLCNSSWCSAAVIPTAKSPVQPTRKTIPFVPPPRIRGPTVESFYAQLQTHTATSASLTTKGPINCVVCREVIQDNPSDPSQSSSYPCCPQHRYHRRCEILAPQRSCPFCGADWWKDTAVKEKQTAKQAVICVMCEEAIPPTETPCFNWCCKDKNPYHAKCRDLKPYLHCPLCNTSWIR